MKTKILFIAGLILFFAYGYSGNGESSKNGNTANAEVNGQDTTTSGGQNVFQRTGQLAGNWKVKSQNLAGEPIIIISPPGNAHYPDISIQIPNTIQGPVRITGNTFYNSIVANLEIKDNQQINFNGYDGTKVGEDDRSLAFKDNLLNTVKFRIRDNNELIFLDSQDKPTIVFIRKSAQFNVTAPSLTGAKWKLSGIVDVKTGELNAFESYTIDGKYCEKCYTITFKENGTFTGFSTTNEMHGNYLIDYPTHDFKISGLGGTKVGEVGNGYLYWDILRTVQSFDLLESELKLYYNDKDNYLSYKLIDL